jgi:hypothetical protein
VVLPTGVEFHVRKVAHSARLSGNTIAPGNDGHDEYRV